MLVVISGPSGSGKSTVAEQLRKVYKFEPLVSYTTRPKRLTDKLGEFKYVDNIEFDQMIDMGQFFWHVKPYGNVYRYGTKIRDVSRSVRFPEIYDVALLTGESIPMVHGYALGARCIEHVSFFYLQIDDEVELRRRLAQDPSRTDIEVRLKAAVEENRQVRQSVVPYHFIDARLPPQEVMDQIIPHIP